MSRRAGRREQGSALLIAVLMLVLMGLIGIAALDAVTRDGQVAGYLNRKKLAFYAAEAGAAKALETMTNTGTPTIPVTQLGDGTLYPTGAPSFRPDTNVATPIENLGSSGYPGMELQIGQDGEPLYSMQTWRVHVEGRAVGGSVARIEFVTSALISN